MMLNHLLQKLVFKNSILQVNKEINLFIHITCNPLLRILFREYTAPRTELSGQRNPDGVKSALADSVE